jgi:hypothetical protein
MDRLSRGGGKKRKKQVGMCIPTNKILLEGVEDMEVWRSS